MKLTINPLEQLREGTRRSEAKPLALNAAIVSQMVLDPPRTGHPHEHAMEISSSGFVYLSSFEQFQEELSERLVELEFSHFAFRNSLICLVNNKFLAELEEPIIEEESGMKMQVFLAAYLQDAWLCDNTVAITLDRKAVGAVELEGEQWTAFVAAAILPCSQEEWFKTLEARRMEVKWAEMFWAQKEAKANMAAAQALNSFNLH